MSESLTVCPSPRPPGVNPTLLAGHPLAADGGLVGVADPYVGPRGGIGWHFRAGPVEFAGMERHGAAPIYWPVLG